MLYAILFNVMTGATTVTVGHGSLEACSAAMFAGINRGMEQGQHVQGNCLPAAETLIKLTGCVVVERTAGGELHAICSKL